MQEAVQTIDHAHIEPLDGQAISLKRRVEAYERQLIESALTAAAGNQRRAAAALGLLPTTLHEKMKRLGLLRRPPRDGGA